MRVGVDATSWVNRRGYGRFARNAVRTLVERDRGTTYLMYIDSITAADADLPSGSEIRQVSLRRAPSEAASANSSRSLGDLLRMVLAVRRDRPDVFLFPSIYTYFPVIGTPTVVGIHDAIPAEFPELTVPGRRARLFSRAKERLALMRATRLFTVSQASRRAIAARLGVPEQRLTVVPEAPDAVFHPASAEAVSAATAAVGLREGERYLLYAGGISPHKNLETLIAALARLGAPRPRLVAVGDLEREVYVSAAASVRAQVAALGLESDVLLPGFVSDETLAALYTGACAAVIPSLAEGFGLPAVEAAACGAPVVLSDIAAHRETLGQAAVFFPPRSVERLGDELQRLLADEAARLELGRRCRQAVAGLSWSATADVLIQLLRDAGESGRP
jgi:glycosyltransferase involved in cell wall biosynthesis